MMPIKFIPDEIIREMVRQRRLQCQLCNIAVDLGFITAYDGEVQRVGDCVLAGPYNIMIENKIFLGDSNEQVTRKLFSSVKWSRHLIIALAEDRQHIIWGQEEV